MTADRRALIVAVEAINRFVAGDYGGPSRNRRCKHGRYGYECCKACADRHFERVLTRIAEMQRTAGLERVA